MNTVQQEYKADMTTLNASFAEMKADGAKRDSEAAKR